jgi:hypothetical protein
VDFTLLAEEEGPFIIPQAHLLLVVLVVLVEEGMVIIMLVKVG